MAFDTLDTSIPKASINTSFQFGPFNPFNSAIKIYDDIVWTTYLIRKFFTN